MPKYAENFQKIKKAKKFPKITNNKILQKKNCKIILPKIPKKIFHRLLTESKENRSMAESLASKMLSKLKLENYSETDQLLIFPQK